MSFFGFKEDFPLFNKERIIFMNTAILTKQNIPEIADVLCEAFYNYPVMKYVLGEKQDYDTRLRKAVTFFVSARALRNEPMFGIYNQENKLIAAAVVTLPGDIPIPEELKRIRENLWKELGKEEETRYEKYGKAASGLLPTESHQHLNMIGVRNAYQGKGLARQLINKVEELVEEHPTSTGLSLNTEVEANVNFYIHLGYELVGKAKVDKGIQTWGFFKPKL
jgi:GNAT superfamily N-acetyltransferase